MFAHFRVNTAKPVIRLNVWWRKHCLTTAAAAAIGYTYQLISETVNLDQ